MQNFCDNSIIERIKLLRNQYAGGRGKKKFAQELGISASTYNYYENDRIPPLQTLLKIWQVTGADLEWLLTGKESQEKFAFGKNTPLLQKLDALLTENPGLAEPVSAFLYILHQKEQLGNDPGMPQNPPVGSEVSRSETPDKAAKRSGWIPVLGRTAAGMVHVWDEQILPGSKQAVTELEQLVEKHIGKNIVKSTDAPLSIDFQLKTLIDNIKNPHVNLIQVTGDGTEEIVEFVDCEEIFRMFPDSFALQVDGDSMAPRINDGDIIILSPSVPAAQGQIAVARIANQIGVTCKLIRITDEIVHLIPINEKYETKLTNKKDLLWALTVLCHISL